MSERTEVAKLDELELGVPRRIVVSDVAICVVRCADTVHAVSDTCSHEDYSLAEGEVDAEVCEIECWKHGSLFSLETGEAVTLPATQPIAVYPVAVEDGRVFVEIG